MNLLKAFGDLVSPNDPELVEKTLARITEQDTWNDVFSTKLIELLDNIDLIKSEIRREMRAAESVTQAASASLACAERAQNQISQSTLEAKRLLDQSARQLDLARNCAEEATSKLRAAQAHVVSTEQNLKKACELEREAEKKQFNAAKLLRIVVRYSALAVAASWAATVWMAWLLLRQPHHFGGHAPSQAYSLWARCSLADWRKMRPEYRKRWETEIRSREEPLKKPLDLLRRAVSSEDFVDAAVIGGVGVADILAGKVAEWQIPSDVLEAFHAQYPQHASSFVDAVNHLSGHPDQLAGLISGVKGKLFEINYVEWLNHGHLPTGWTAALADQANNPSWDIAIHDAHGNLNEVLQLKATASLAYVKEAIAAHPDIDVVIPHELYERLTDHPELFAHLVDGHQMLGHLSDDVATAAVHAEAAANHLDFPLFAPIVVIGFAAFQNRKKYREGKITLQQALQTIGERGVLAIVASSVGWAVHALAHSTWPAIPVSMALRLAIGQVRHNRNRRKLLSVHIDTVASSTRRLQDQIGRPLLDAPIR